SATTPPVPGLTGPRGMSGSSNWRGCTMLPDRAPTTAPRSGRAPGGPAPRAERPAVGRSAADRVDQRAERTAELHLDDARPLQVPREAEELRAASAAQTREPRAAARADRRTRRD